MSIYFVQVYDSEVDIDCGSGCGSNVKGWTTVSTRVYNNGCFHERSVSFETRDDAECEALGLCEEDNGDTRVVESRGDSLVCRVLQTYTLVR